VLSLISISGVPLGEWRKKRSARPKQKGVIAGVRPARIGRRFATRAKFTEPRGGIAAAISF
jgi:hypothetical protein